MPNLHNAKGQPVKMSFLDIFGASTSSRSKSGVSRMQRKKVRMTLNPANASKMLDRHSILSDTREAEERRVVSFH